MGPNRCCSTIGVHMARQLRLIGLARRGGRRGTGGARRGLVLDARPGEKAKIHHRKRKSRRRFVILSASN